MEGSDNRWARKEWRRERRGCRSRSATGGFVFGLVIIFIGTVMLLGNLGIIHARDLWDYAPLILVAIGISKIVECQGRPAGSLFGGLLTAGGTLWFLGNIDVLRIEARFIWPVAIIGFGVLFLFRAVERQFHPDTPVSPNADSQAQINIATVFGGVKRFVDAPDFRSADLFACFGGVEIDFRGAKIQERAVIDANAVFGGIEIRVPRTWLVEVRGTGIFGGYEDKTLHPDESTPGPIPKLTITGLAVFGGVTVYSV